jgi:hypothetical protein
MKLHDNQHDKNLSLIDERFGFPPAVAAIINLIGYTTMALPFAVIVGSLLAGMWGVNELRDFLAAHLTVGAAALPVFIKGIKLVMVLIAARSIFVAVTLLPPFLPDFIESVREGLRKELGL